MKKELVSDRMKLKMTKHGDRKKSKHVYLYKTWGSIKQRCYNVNNIGYKNYGGRGITMYQPWIDDYQSFKTWILENLGERKDGESIDRINVDENYIPGNIRWADHIIQANNRRNNIKESDIIGQKFNRLEIISIARVDKYSNKIVLCKCECGKLKEVSYSNLQSGKTKSCGCLQKEHIQKNLEIKKKTYICDIKWNPYETDKSRAHYGSGKGLQEY